MENWIPANTIYLTVHGSQCYGMATENSDLDVKGICIPPPEIQNDLFHTFEQSDNHPYINKKVEYLHNPQNPKIESTIYSLKKFIKLAAAVNPNVIELLYTDPSLHIIKNEIAQKLLENRNLFISARARFTITSYAFTQLHKIERHRKWINLSFKEKPTRKNYGLPEEPQKELENVFRYIKSQVEEWNLSNISLDKNEKSKLKEMSWDLIYEVCNKKVNWENWVNAYSEAAIGKLEKSFDLKEEIIDLIRRENQYRKDLQDYNSWVHWKENRNPARKEMEEKFGLDLKHACLEILETGQVLVNRPDAKELLEIKNGKWSYDQIIDYTNQMNDKIETAYKTTKLPKSVDYVKINQLYHELIS